MFTPTRCQFPTCPNHSWCWGCGTLGAAIGEGWRTLQQRLGTQWQRLETHWHGRKEQLANQQFWTCSKPLWLFGAQRWAELSQDSDVCAPATGNDKYLCQPAIWELAVAWTQHWWHCNNARRYAGTAQLLPTSAADMMDEEDFTYTIKNLFLVSNSHRPHWVGSIQLGWLWPTITNVAKSSHLGRWVVKFRKMAVSWCLSIISWSLEITLWCSSIAAKLTLT